MGAGTQFAMRRVAQSLSSFEYATVEQSRRKLFLAHVVASSKQLVHVEIEAEVGRIESRQNVKSHGVAGVFVMTFT